MTLPSLSSAISAPGFLMGAALEPPKPEILVFNAPSPFYKLTDYYFTVIQSHTELIRLHLNKWTLDSSILTVLEKMPNLRFLDLSTCSLRNQGGIDSLKLMEGLGRMTFLEELHLPPKMLFDEGFAFLKTLVKLTRLVLHGSILSDTQMNDTLQHFKGLRSLTVSNSITLTDAGLTCLQQMPFLEELHVTWCTNVTGVGLGALSSTHRFFRECTFMACRNVNDDGLDSISQIQTLQSLNISACPKVTPRGVESVAKLVNLSVLNLRYCHGVTDESFRYLTALKALRVLELESAPLSDRYIFQITDASMDSLRTFKELECLVLIRQGVTDTGLRGALKELYKFKTIYTTFSPYITNRFPQGLVFRVQSL